MNNQKQIQNLIYISHLEFDGPVWWMICDDAEIVRLAKKWIEAYPTISQSTDINSIFEEAKLQSPKNKPPEYWKWPALKEFRVWSAVFRNHHPEYKFAIAGPHFHVTDHPGSPSQGEDGDPNDYGCIPCLKFDDSAPYGEDVEDRWVSGFSPGEFCSAHWQEWLEKNPILPAPIPAPEKP